MSCLKQTTVLQKNCSMLAILAQSKHGFIDFMLGRLHDGPPHSCMM
jgi:hypothetical protein